MFQKLVSSHLLGPSLVSAPTLSYGADPRAQIEVVQSYEAGLTFRSDTAGVAGNPNAGVAVVVQDTAIFGGMVLSGRFSMMTEGSPLIGFRAFVFDIQSSGLVVSDVVEPFATPDPLKRWELLSHVGHQTNFFGFGGSEFAIPVDTRVTSGVAGDVRQFGLAVTCVTSGTAAFKFHGSLSLRLHNAAVTSFDPLR